MIKLLWEHTSCIDIYSPCNYPCYCKMLAYYVIRLFCVVWSSQIDSFPIPRPALQHSTVPHEPMAPQYAPAHQTTSVPDLTKRDDFNAAELLNDVHRSPGV